MASLLVSYLQSIAVGDGFLAVLWSEVIRGVSCLSFYSGCVRRQIFHTDQPGHAGEENYSGHK